MHALHIRDWFHREHAVAAHPTMGGRLNHLVHNATFWERAGIVLLIALLVLMIALAVTVAPGTMPPMTPYYMGF